MNDMGKNCYCWGAGNIDSFRTSNIYSSDMGELQSIYNLPLTTLDSNTVGNKISNKNNTLDTLINANYQYQQ
jgi:hypothetical protein